MATMLPPSVINGAAPRASATSGICTDVVCHAERLATGIHKFAFECFLRRKSNGVQKEIQFAKFFADGFKYICDVFILRHIARQNQGVCAESTREFLGRCP